MTVAYGHGGWGVVSRARTAAPEIPSDEVFRRIANGDRLAMRALFARHRLPIYRYLLRSVGDAAVAEGMLRDVFLEVWRNAATFAGCSSASTWLLAIARKKTLSARRSRLAALGHEAASAGASTWDEPELVQNKSREEVLRHSLVRLSPEHGEVLDLVYYHGKSVREVAEIVGISETSVKTRVCNARRQLAELAGLRTYALALKSHSSCTALDPKAALQPTGVPENRRRF
jgi:RNA polymerase sigma-70 factor (ECF subfamily)